MSNQNSEAVKAARKARQKANAHLKHNNAEINAAAQARFEAQAAANPAQFAPPCDNVKISSDYYGDIRRMSARW